MARVFMRKTGDEKLLLFSPSPFDNAGKLLVFEKRSFKVT